MQLLGKGSLYFYMVLHLLLTNWCQHVFIAQGSGMTVKYIIAKSSACVESFHAISHDVARYFGNSDHSCHHKEFEFFEDMCILIKDMLLKNVHVATKDQFVPGPSCKLDHIALVQTAIFNVMVAGVEVWENAKFQQYIHTTCDPALGYLISDLHSTPDKIQE